MKTFRNNFSNASTTSEPLCCTHGFTRTVLGGRGKELRDILDFGTSDRSAQSEQLPGAGRGEGAASRTSGRCRQATKTLQNNFSDAPTSSGRLHYTQGSVRDSRNGRGKGLRDIRDFRSSPSSQQCPRRLPEQVCRPRRCWRSS